ncbi:MAG: response regulator [Dehalococcoidia bacterium]|nr:response regulator [Dehalococcoidia bacterium]
MKEKLRILIVDDDHRMAKTLVDILTVKGYEVEAAYSGPEALVKVKKGYFDFVLTDIKMPEMNGVELYRAIKEMKPDLPVVMMTAYSANRLVKEGLEQGILATLNKPLDINLVLSFLSSLRKEHSIVIVDDDPQFCKTLGEILENRGFRVTEVADPSNLEEILRSDIQVVLLDMKLDGKSGLEVLKDIRKQYPHLPVILVTAYRAEMTQAIEASLKISAYTCLYKPFQIEELLQVLSEIQHKELGTILGQSVRKRKCGGPRT